MCQRSSLQFTQSIDDRLRSLTNSYEEQERCFSYGALPLIDCNDALALPTLEENARLSYIRTRKTVFHSFLSARKPSPPSISVLIPVRGRKIQLKHCLSSLAQQSYVK